MTTSEKLTTLKTFLNITGAEQDVLLSAYLDLSKAEILSWMYSGDTPEDITDVPTRYEAVQIMACVAGYGISGAENQTAHSENGISRTFKYEDMIAYIRSHVAAYVVLV